MTVLWGVMCSVAVCQTMWCQILQGNNPGISVCAGGNPVTGEGYIATAADSEKGSPTPPTATASTGAGSAEIRRNRVPPGGYSSGLW